jgi:hypothetical protein
LGQHLAFVNYVPGIKVDDRIRPAQYRTALCRSYTAKMRTNCAAIPVSASASGQSP